MAYINSNKQKEVFVDASTGLGAILIQCQNVVAYARKALTDIENIYSQIEREALATACSCHHFRMYLLGKHFSAVSDHQPYNF